MNNKILTKRLIKGTSKTRWLQKPAVTIIIALLGLALVLVVMTRNIIKYESHLATGDTEPHAVRLANERLLKDMALLIQSS